MNNETTDDHPGKEFESEIFSAFLQYLKQETGHDVRPRDAVFGRNFAKYRHQPYPDSEADAWKADFMVRSWINVILREGLSDGLRLHLFPNHFDLGNILAFQGLTATLSDLLEELNEYPEKIRGTSASGITTEHLETCLKGIKHITGLDLQGKNVEYHISVLKVVRLFYKLTKHRKSHLFGLIEPPYVSFKPTMEFKDASPDPFNEEDSLLVADLISYLSLEIPEERLKHIHVQLLTSSKLLECIVNENEEIVAPIRARHSDNDKSMTHYYLSVAERIKNFRAENTITFNRPLDEIIYTYLRTLRFQHFVGEYEQIVIKSSVKIEMSESVEKINLLCKKIGAINEQYIDPYTEIISINTFQDFVKNNDKGIRKTIKSITGLSIRREHLDGDTRPEEKYIIEIVSHAKKILTLYLWHSFKSKNLDEPLLSVSDCIAALSAVRYQQSSKTNHAPYWFGQDEPRDGILRFFAREKGIKELQETDYIPQGIAQLMYIRFCHIHAIMAGQGERHEAWMQFQVERLNKYSQCLQSYDIDTIIHSVRQFNDYCNLAVNMTMLPELPTSLVNKINIWLGHD